MNKNNSIINFSYELSRAYLTDKFNESSLFSPFSFFTILAVMGNASFGTTRNKILNVLDYDNITRLNQDFQDLALSNTITDFKMSNFIFYQGSLKDKFTKTFKSCYKGIGRQIDASQVNESLDIVNNCIKESTNGQIDRFISFIPPATDLMIINTLYFEGKWRYPFKVIRTKKKDFNSGNKTSLVDMMCQRESIYAIERPKYKAVAMDYENYGYSMIFVLPEIGVKICDVAKEITTKENIKDLMHNMKEYNVSLEVPRFTEEIKIPIESLLENVGLKDLFIDHDFSSIMDGTIHSNLSLFQTSVIEVNEMGSKTSATTSSLLYLDCCLPDDKMTFHLNRPFLYYLVKRVGRSLDTFQYLPLFIGVYNGPASH